MQIMLLLVTETTMRVTTLVMLLLQTKRSIASTTIIVRFLVKRTIGDTVPDTMIDMMDIITVTRFKYPANQIGKPSMLWLLEVVSILCDVNLKVEINGL